MGHPATASLEMTQSQSLLEVTEMVASKPASQSATVEVLYLTTAGDSVPALDDLQEQINGVLAKDGWLTVPVPRRPKLLVAGKSYVYAVDPPRIGTSRRRRLVPVPQWDDLAELPILDPAPFATSDFISTLRPQPNLWTLLPNPHLLPSPHHIPHLPPECPKEFRPKGNISPYARSTVYIPIAGSLPYGRASPATISEIWSPPRHVDPPPPMPLAREPIIWTPPSVQRLWHFLIKIQEKGNCGPIGISYQPSHIAAMRPSSSSEQPRKKAKLTHTLANEDCAYIKVYCPTILKDYLLHALRNFPAGKDEDRRKPLAHARFASVGDDGSVSIG